MNQMNEKFQLVHFDGGESVTARLYRRTYFTATGKAKTRLYGVFTDWQGVRRKISAGKDLKGAIRKLYHIDRKNHAEVDFDALKQKRAAKVMTFSKFVAQCPEQMKSMTAWHLKHLEAFFDSKPLAQICDDDVIATARSGQGRQSSATVKSPSNPSRRPRSTKNWERFGSSCGSRKKGYGQSDRVQDGRGDTTEPNPYQRRVFRALGKLFRLAKTRYCYGMGDGAQPLRPAPFDVERNRYR